MNISLQRSHRKTFNVTCSPRPPKAPFLAGALRGPKGEALGVEQISLPGGGGRKSSPTYSPCRAPHRSPPKGLQEQSPGCGATSLSTRSLTPTQPHGALSSRDPSNLQCKLACAPPRLFGWSEEPPPPHEVSHEASRAVPAPAPPSVSLLVPELRRPGSIPGSPRPTP